MEFLVRRSSIWRDEKKPCSEAKSKKFVYVDRRTVKTLQEARLPEYKHWADAFFASGTNHREENGMIARDLDLEIEWVIEINTLEDLLRFSDKYGKIILDHEDEYKGVNRSIEICDNYW